MMTILQRRNSWIAFVAWSLPGWIAVLSFVTDRLARDNPFGLAWQLASRGKLLGLVAPVAVVFLILAWRRLRPIAPSETLWAIVLAAPTLIATVAALALAFQTFVGTI